METLGETTPPPPQPLRCANCRIAVGSERTVLDSGDYCCDGCAAGGPCGC